MSSVPTWLVSVRGRITVAVTVVFGLAMALGGWFLLDRAEAAWIEDLEAADLAELEMLAQDLQAFEMIVGEEFLLPVGVDGTSFELFDETGQLVGQTPQGVFGSGVLVEGVVPFDQVPQEVVSGSSGVIEFGVVGDITTVSLPVELSTGTVTLTASSSLQPVEAGVNALRDILLVVVPLLVAGVGASAWFVTGRAFQPVADITSQVERITDDRLEERVPVPSSRDEVAHLARTMNTMLDRLAASRGRQRQFVSDASHELRNPVATSKTKLEVALAHPEDADWEETAAVVLEEQERLGSLVDDMLLLARIDEGRPVVSEEVDLDDIVFAEASRAHGANISISAVEPVRVLGDLRQLTRLVRNLVDNAVRHAAERIVVTLAEDDGWAGLVVEDDGPGIADADWKRVFDRFVRLEDARTRDEGGVGLGLALVAGVAGAHGGSAAVGDSSLGGARFEVRLPVATAD